MLIAASVLQLDKVCLPVACTPLILLEAAGILIPISSAETTTSEESPGQCPSSSNLSQCGKTYQSVRISVVLQWSLSLKEAGMRSSEEAGLCGESKLCLCNSPSCTQVTRVYEQVRLLVWCTGSPTGLGLSTPTCQEGKCTHLHVTEDPDSGTLPHVSMVLFLWLFLRIPPDKSVIAKCSAFLSSVCHVSKSSNLRGSCPE